MPNLLTPETFEFFARYLLAGIVLISVRSRFIKGDRPETSERIFEAIILSLINQAVFLFLSRLAAAAIDIGSVDPQVLLMSEVLVLPAVLGIAAGWNLSRGWNRAFLRRLSMPIEHPVERAYDFAFERHQDGALVIVSFKDGTVVQGLFGAESLAANDPNRSEIYLERLYEVRDDGQWIEPQPGRSALISLDDLRSIEFLDQERRLNDQ